MLPTPTLPNKGTTVRDKRHYEEGKGLPDEVADFCTSETRVARDEMSVYEVKRMTVLSEKKSKKIQLIFMYLDFKYLFVIC